MRKKSLLILALGVLLATMGMLAGCGSGSTSGTLAVADITKTDLTGGKYSVETSATFAPAIGTVLPNTEISFTASFTGGINTTRNGKLFSDSTGKVSIGPWEVTQDTVPTIVVITATTGDLSSTKMTSIPAVSPLTVTPQAVPFANTDTAGTTKTVAITGGFSPYSVTSGNPGDISVSNFGGTVTITKLTVSGLTNTSTTVTVTDTKGNQQTITVGYFR